jgi:hypothetical protein
MLLYVYLFWLVGSVAVRAFMPCDDAYGQHCPEDLGWAVGDCLRKQADLPAACSAFIVTHDKCRAELQQYCDGKEYSAYAYTCLTEWTKPEQLSTECLAALPSKETPVKRELTDKEKKKADARRKIRNKAARMARDL